MRDWLNIGLKELVYAYRKAKADCFFERSMYLSLRFAEFESDLTVNLQSILDRLHEGEIDDLLHENLGEPRIVGKKLSAERRDQVNDHCFFSDPERAFSDLITTTKVNPEFRVVGDFPVTMHVLSALWINEIGHQFDAVLSSSSYGSRLRRFRSSASGSAAGNYHLHALGSFEPYYEPYQKWRRGGLDSIKAELSSDTRVIAMSLDFTNYYHNVDARLLADERFQSAIGVGLTEWEQEFTASLSTAIHAWGELANQLITRVGGPLVETHGGLPIGLSAVRIISNALLAELDRDIETRLSPIYYGRYVDDIFIVLRDPGTVTSPEQLWKFISERSSFFDAVAPGQSVVKFRTPDYWGETSLVLQKSKQKLFFLSGKAGLDLLSSIDAQIKSVSSERRLMPSAEGLADTASAQVLTAAGPAAEEADTLRRADGLAVKRLGWAVQLRAVELLAKNLSPSDWQVERNEFFEFAKAHIIRPDKILEHFDYLPRLISIAVAMREWRQASKLIDATFQAIQSVEQIGASSAKMNGVDVSVTVQLWEGIRLSLTEMCVDAVLRAIPWQAKAGEPFGLTRAGEKLCQRLGLGRAAEVARKALLIREADLAKTPYKEHVRRDAARERPLLQDEDLLADVFDFVNDLKAFLEKSRQRHHDIAVPRVRPTIRAKRGKSAPSLLPYLFPTRPYTTREIALFLPEDCVVGQEKEPPVAWARYVRAVRGAWVKFPEDAPDRDHLGGSGGVNGGSGSGARRPPPAVVGIADPTRRVRLGISSLYTSEVDWTTAASGRSSIARARYDRVRTIVNHAINSKPRPTHLLLPELSLPERWIPTVSSILSDAGISLIAGLDYQTHGNSIHSSAVLVLEDNRLGFTSWIELRQPKLQPAPLEDMHLRQLFNKSWTDFDESDFKPLYSHFGFCFGVLICSELQNIAYRKTFQGEVDCVMVLSWNQDIETFSSLVDSASLDVHAYIALVNNRRFGDSRVRAPAKAIFNRDLCRLRGGENDHLVVVELKPSELRAFQSRALRWPNDNDPYKPVPENYRISPQRETLPK